MQPDRNVEPLLVSAPAKGLFSVDAELARRIVDLAWPVVLAMAAQTVINVVDDAFIGRIGADARPGQAALGPAMGLFWAVGGFFAAISVGTQALTARRSGELSPERAGQVLLNSLLVALVTATLGSIAGWFSAPYLFPLINPKPDVMRLGVPYLQWRLLGVAAMVTTVSCKSWFDGLGKTRIFLSAAVLMNIANFFLNYALIFGKWGFPALGVTGSAIASMVSSYFGLALMLGWTLHPQFRKTYRHYRISNLSIKQAWEICKLSVPSGLATACVMFGFLLFYKIAGRVDVLENSGEIAAAATHNVITLLMMLFTGAMAYGAATATLVGQSMGAEQPALAERYGWEAVKIGVLGTIVLGAAIALFPDPLLDIVCKGDFDVIAAARPILRVCGVLLPFILASLTLTQALFGAGNTRYVMFVEFGLHFFCLVPIAALGGLVFKWGLLGVWIGAYVYILLLCALMAWKFAEGKWKQIRI